MPHAPWQHANNRCSSTQCAGITMERSFADQVVGIDTHLGLSATLKATAVKTTETSALSKEAAKMVTTLKVAKARL